MTEPKRRAFEPEPIQPAQKKLELKLDNKASFAADLPKQPSREEGQKQATETNARLNGYAEQAGKLALGFKTILNDKTLAINKSIIAKDAERSLILDIAALGTAINNDSREKEGEGAMGAILLLLGTVLSHRDKVNELGYADEQHAKHITKLEANVMQLGTQVKILEAQVNALTIDKPKASG